MSNVRKFALTVVCLGVSLWGMQTVRAADLPNFVELVKETSSAVVNISTCLLYTSDAADELT